MHNCQCQTRTPIINIHSLTPEQLSKHFNTAKDFFIHDCQNIPNMQPFINILNKLQLDENILEFSNLKNLLHHSKEHIIFTTFIEWLATIYKHDKNSLKELNIPTE
jgi:hypothetical protein